MALSRPMVYIVFGIFLGAFIGFVDGAIGLRVWDMLGQPDFFVRRGWGEQLHLILPTFSGGVVGILYGWWLILISHLYATRLRLGYIFCCCVGISVPIFSFMHYYVIDHRIPLTVVGGIPEMSVFLISAIFAVWLKRKHTRTE